MAKKAVCLSWVQRAALRHSDPLLIHTSGPLQDPKPPLPDRLKLRTALYNSEVVSQPLKGSFLPFWNGNFMTFLETPHLVKYCSFSHSCTTAKMEDNLGKFIILREENVRIKHSRLQCLSQWPQSSSQTRKTLQVHYDPIHFSCKIKYATSDVSMEHNCRSYFWSKNCI